MGPMTSMPKEVRTGYTQSDVAYGPVQAQEVNSGAKGVELVFYINTPNGKVSRVWWLRHEKKTGDGWLRFRFATDEETQQAAAARES